MSAQVIFHLLLIVYGILTGAFTRLPTTIIALTGLLWGGLLWVVVALLLLLSPLDFNLETALAALALIGLVLIGLHLYLGTWRSLIAGWRTWLITLAAYGLLLLLLGSVNYSHTSIDGIVMITLGRSSVTDGLSPLVSYQGWGVFLPLMHAAAEFTGDDYLHIYGPLMTLSFVPLFLYLGRQLSLGWFVSRQTQYALLGIASAVFFTTFVVVWQALFIHTNLISTIYLFVAISALWLADGGADRGWHAVAVAALLAFSLLRVESALFATLFLLIWWSRSPLSIQARRTLLLGYALPTLAWTVTLLLLVLTRQHGTSLQPQNIAVVMLSLLLLVGVALLANWPTVQRITPSMPRLIQWGLAGILVGMFVLKPVAMVTSAGVMLLNFLVTGYWLPTGILVCGVLVFVHRMPRFSRDDLWHYGLPSFLMLLLALSFFRLPYRIGAGDSANRIMTHIMPLLILYLTARVGLWLWPAQTPPTGNTAPSPPAG